MVSDLRRIAGARSVPDFRLECNPEKPVDHVFLAAASFRGWESVRTAYSSTKTRLILEQCGYVGVDFFGRVRGGEPCDYRTVAVHEEFREVPFAAASDHSLFLLLQVFVERVGVASVHLNFRELGERGVVVQGAELCDFLIASGRLVSELVAGEVQDFKAFLVILLVESVESLVLRGEAASCRSVYYEHDLAVELAEFHVISFSVFYRVVINLCHSRLLLVSYNYIVRYFIFNVKHYFKNKFFLNLLDK